MSKITEEMRKDAERDWRAPRHEIKVLEYIERPEFKTTIMFYRVDYPGTNYSATRIKVRPGEGGGYDVQIALSGNIRETV